MAVTECEACGNKVNVAAVKCPHCGAKRAAVTMADAKLSKDEIKALLTTDNHVPDPEAGPGLLSTMFLPHDQTTGKARTVELVLTVLCSPLVVMGIISIAFGRRRIRRKILAARGEWISATAMSFFGGLGFYSIVDLLKGPAVLLTALSIVGLWVRALIRSNADAWRAREMQRLPEPEEPPPARESVPQLPVARARQVTGPSVEVPTAPRVDPPSAEPQTPGADEPRLLR